MEGNVNDGAKNTHHIINKPINENIDDLRHSE